MAMVGSADAGSSRARRSEHVEVTLSGWRSVWMESEEPALSVDTKRLVENKCTILENILPPGVTAAAVIW